MKKSFKKRVNKFIKRYLLSILLAVAVYGGLLLAFFELHSIATVQRGYEAIGGEILIFALPLIVYIGFLNAKDTAAIIKKRGK